MADERGGGWSINSNKVLHPPTSANISVGCSGEHDESTTAAPPFTHHPGYPMEIADMGKAQIDQSDLYPSQEAMYKNAIETLLVEPPKLH
ncbi:uncharacterized protein EI90DRAFT_3115025 [Cantharellus anzutake]|uniref:uncharacterized protein n=1 Tax=Cantharellus anzutake TaxID=1750568 RepID=UPI0019089321|nr:uncharacterized protein EI90DRAFT_3115025 [Cantharellus anzutake]KAF8344274.1 hypothetical protein EI90DRAFT_3115025 [Cantharellus anzutake]